MSTLALTAVSNRLVTGSPVEFDGVSIIGLWEKLIRPSFKPLEFETFSFLDGHMRTLLAEPSLKRLKA